MIDKSTVTQTLLDSLNVEQAREENRAHLEELGGAEKLCAMIGVNVATGLSHPQVVAQRAKFGDNTFPESPMASYLELLIASLSDTTLLILIAAAAVSLVIGILSHPEDGWVEGTAIFIAVFLVSNISAGNDYTKQLQFKALEASSAKDERTSVLREGSIERINPKDLVVGDIIVLQVKARLS
jgi:Ca2+-transporting ATPase